MTAERLEPRHRRTVVRVIVATQLVLALVTSVVITLAYQELDQNFTSGDNIDHKVKKKHLIGGDPLNILVLGSDTRGGVGNAIDAERADGQRADTTILVHVSADRKTVYGVSLPRDAMVARPDCEGPDGEVVPGGELEMFNTAFAVGGETCAVAMVEELTGIYIDHYLTIDFNGFKQMVDAVDGVTVCIPEDIDDQEHGIEFDAGTQELDGQQALDYVRERSSTPNADIGRMKRQQAFIASMVNKVVSADTLTRPNRVYSFLKAATGSIVTDPGLGSLSKLVDLALQFRRTDLDHISFITVPIQEYPEDPDRLIWAPEAGGLWKVIAADRPLPKRYREGVITADRPPGVPTGTPTGTATGGGEPSGSATASPPPSGNADPEGDQEADASGLCT